MDTPPASNRHSTLADAGLAHRELPLPDGRSLATGDCIHAYPGKRVLTQGRINGHPVVAKFYLRGWRGWLDWHRGHRGARALTDAGLPAPAIRFAGYLDDAAAWLLVLDFIDQDEPWPPQGKPDPHLHERIIRMLAAHHAAGIVQNDLNWTNFRPGNGALHTLDSDRIRKHPVPMQNRHALWNLIRLYAYKGDFDDPDIRHGYRMYCNLRKWPIDARNQQRFVDQVQRWRERIARDVARRSLRGWKHYRRGRAGAWHGIIDRRRLDPDRLQRLVELQEERVPQADALLRLDDTVLREHPLAGRHIPGTRGPVEHHWMLLIRLRRLRIATELPTAMIRRRISPLRSRGCIYTRMIETRPVEEFADDCAGQELAVRRIGMLFSRLAHARLHLPATELSAFGATASGEIIILDWARIRPAPNADANGIPQKLINDITRRLDLPAEQIRALLGNPFMP